MNIGISQGYCLSLRQALECSFCGQLMDSDEAKNTIVSANIFGAIKYAVCLNCFQSVHKCNWTTSYKRKWTHRFNKSKVEK